MVKKFLFMLMCVCLFGCTSIDQPKNNVNYQFSLNDVDTNKLNINLIEILSDQNIIVGENDTLIIDEIHGDIVYFHKNTRDFTQDLFYTDLIASFNINTNEIIQYDSLIDQKLVTFLTVYKDQLLLLKNDGFYIDGNLIYKKHGILFNYSWKEDRILLAFSNLTDIEILSFDGKMQVKDVIKGTVDEITFGEDDYYYLKEQIIYSSKDEEIATKCNQLVNHSHFLFNYGDIIDVNTKERTEVDLIFRKEISSSIMDYKHFITFLSLQDDEFLLSQSNIYVNDEIVITDLNQAIPKYIIISDPDLRIYQFYQMTE